MASLDALGDEACRLEREALELESDSDDTECDDFTRAGCRRRWSMGFAAGDPYCTVGSSGEVDAGLEAELDAAALGQGGAGRSAWGRLGRTSPPPLELRVVEVPFGGSGPVVCVASAGVRTSQSVVSPLSEASTTLPGDPYRDDGLGGTSDCEDD